MQSSHRLLTKTRKLGTYLSMTLPTVWRGSWAHACQLEKGLGGGLGEKCLFLNIDQVYSASQKNNCICPKGNNVLQHKDKNEPSR